MPRDSLTDLPEPDRIEGAPHPRETPRLYGQAAAEAQVLDAVRSGRFHQAWLICGPRGVGKATLAWRIAAFLLASPEPGGLFAPAPPESLDVPPDDPVARRLRALSEPRLTLLRRGPNEKGDALSPVIGVEEVRRLIRGQQLRETEGRRRVAIVDAADELNIAAANALLKVLEEPPAGTVFLIVAHQPARLLPTIRSRCRTLVLAPLGPDDLAAALAQAGIEAGDPVAMAELAQGAPGTAVRIARGAGLALYADLVGLAAGLPRLDRARAARLSETLAGRGAEDRFDLFLALLDRFLARLARRGATGTARPEAAPGEAAVLARLSPDPAAARLWAEAAQTLTERARKARAVNIDAAALGLDLLLRIGETAGRTAARGAVP